MIEDEIVKELSKKYGKRKKFIEILVKICKDLYVENPKEKLDKYLMGEIKFIQLH